jgi:hypothetical protein
MAATTAGAKSTASAMFSGKQRKRKGSTRIVLVTLDGPTYDAVKKLAESRQISMSAVLRGWALEQLGKPKRPKAS